MGEASRRESPSFFPPKRLTIMVLKALWQVSGPFLTLIPIIVIIVYLDSFKLILININSLQESDADIDKTRFD